MKTTEQVAILIALKKVVDERLTELRANADAELKAAYEADGVTKKALRIGDTKVGDYTLNTKKAHWKFKNKEAFEEFALEYGIAEYEFSVKSECRLQARNYLLEHLPEVMMQEVKLDKNWEKHITNNAGTPFFEDSELIVPGLELEPEKSTYTTVRGCKPEDVIPLVQQLGGVETLLLGTSEIKSNEITETDTSIEISEDDEMKNINWNGIEEKSFDTIEVGGYVAVITKVADSPSEQCLDIVFDIKEGPRAGYYNTDWGRQYENAHSFRRYYSESSLGIFKGLLNCLEKSNPNFNTQNWQQRSNEQEFVGLELGVVLQYKLVTYRGEDRRFLEVARTYSSKEIREGKFVIPEPVDKRKKVSSSQDVEQTTYYAQPVQAPAQMQANYASQPQAGQAYSSQPQAGQAYANQAPAYGNGQQQNAAYNPQAVNGAPEDQPIPF